MYVRLWCNERCPFLIIYDVQIQSIAAHTHTHIHAHAAPTIVENTYGKNNREQKCKRSIEIIIHFSLPVSLPHLRQIQVCGYVECKYIVHFVIIFYCVDEAKNGGKGMQETSLCELWATEVVNQLQVMNTLNICFRIQYNNCYSVFTRQVCGPKCVNWIGNFSYLY